MQITKNGLADFNISKTVFLHAGLVTCKLAQLQKVK